MRTRKQKTEFVLAIIATALLVLVSHAAPDAQARGEALSEVMAPLRQAVSIAAMGLVSVSPEDGQINAQALINLIEGANGEHYDPAIKSVAGFPAGLRPHLEHVAALSKEASGLAENGKGELDNYLRILNLVAESLLGVLDGVVDAQAASDAFLTALVFLSSSYTDFQDLLQRWQYAIWVSDGESIQSAIDEAWPGAEISIEPGVYRETLEISKDIALRGIGGDVILEPVAGQDGIIILSGSADVRLAGLQVRSAAIGLHVFSGATCSAESVNIQACEIGIRAAGENVDVRFFDCAFQDNVTALHVLGQASATITSCRVEGSTSDLASVVIEGLSDARITECTISSGLGSGLYVHGSSSVLILESVFEDNALDGIHVDTGSSIDLAESVLINNGGFGLRFDTIEGSISGSLNDFGGDNLQAANTLGAYWPSDLTFLEIP